MFSQYLPSILRPISASSVLAGAGRLIHNNAAPLTSLFSFSQQSKITSYVYSLASSTHPSSTVTACTTHFPTLHSTNISSASASASEIPPIAVDSWVAICDGEKAGFGHAREYIQLKKLNFHEPSTCRHCGLRYFRKGSSDFAHAHE